MVGLSSECKSRNLVSMQNNLILHVNLQESEFQFLANFFIC